MSITKWITRHVRGKPCTSSQLEITNARIIAWASLIGFIAGVAALAVLCVWITINTFAL